MTAPELKPCPFCGGKPYLANVEMVGCAYVVCTDCRTQSDDMLKERAISAWNTRADLCDPMSDPRVVALVEALRYIAKQNKTDELETEYDVEGADFDGGYDAIIDIARAAVHGEKL